MTESVRRGTRIAHIGIAVRAIDELLPFMRDVLDMPEVPLGNSDGATIVGLASGESLVELLEAQAEDTPIGKYVAKARKGNASRFSIRARQAGCSWNCPNTSPPVQPAQGALRG